MVREINKKGLSQVVTTVLIILLVLVAVVLIWTFVRPTIDRTGEQLSTECLTLNLEATSCTDDGAGETTVVVRRNVGAGTVEELRFVFGDGEGNSHVLSSTETGAPDELGTASYTVETTGDANVNVAAVIADGTICEPLNAAIDCAA